MYNYSEIFTDAKLNHLMFSNINNRKLLKENGFDYHPCQINLECLLNNIENNLKVHNDHISRESIHNTIYSTLSYDIIVKLFEDYIKLYNIYNTIDVKWDECLYACAYKYRKYKYCIEFYTKMYKKHFSNTDNDTAENKEIFNFAQDVLTYIDAINNKNYN